MCLLALKCGGAFLLVCLLEYVYFPTLDPSNAGLVEEGEYEDYQEEDQGQVADQGKPSYKAHDVIL